MSFCEDCANEVHRRRTFRSHQVVPLEAPEIEGLQGFVDGMNDLDMSLGPDSMGPESQSRWSDSLFPGRDGTPNPDAPSLREMARDLRKLRDEWKVGKGSVDSVLSMLGKEADATYQEVQGHFRQLHATLEVREELMMNELKQLHTNRCTPLTEHGQLIDGLTGESKRIIRLARGNAAKEPTVENKVMQLVQSEFERQKAIQASVDLPTLLAVATDQKLRFSTNAGSGIDLAAMLQEHGSVLPP
jgi:hypothetical protein